MVTQSIRRLLLLATSIFIIQFLFGQRNIQTDSLIQVLRITHDNRMKARILLRIAHSYEISNPENSLNYALQAWQMAKKAGFDSAEVRAMILMGVNYSRLILLKEAIETGQQIVKKAAKANMKLEIADGRTIMAVAYAQGGDFDNSSKLYFENLKLYEKLQEKRLLAGTLGNIGVDFIEQQNYEKALEYINKALSIGLAINDKIILTDQYNNIASIYYTGFHNLPEALKYFLKSYEIALKIKDFQLQGRNMLNIGQVYLDMNRKDSAYYYFNQSLSVFQQLNNPVLMADSYIGLGKYYYLNKDYSNAIKYALNGFNIGKEYGKYQTIFDASALLHNISQSKKDTSAAYQFLIAKNNAKDSLYGLQNNKELFKLEFQYQQEKLVQEQKLRQIKYYFLLGIIIMVLASGLAIATLFNSRQKIKIKNTTLEKEKVESDLKFKSKELSINLMALLKKNELIAEISKKLTELENPIYRQDPGNAIVKLNQEIKQHSNDKLWQEFSQRFKDINSEFYDKLIKKFPELSQSELKLCAYLRLNMSTKEISDLTGQRTESIEKSRYRLRKKLGLTNSESNLVVFLSQV